jgi:hypothetical protein
MTLYHWIGAVNAMCLWVWAFVICTITLMNGRDTGWVRDIRSEFFPFRWYVTAVYVFTDQVLAAHDGRSWWVMAPLYVGMITWCLLMKNDDDDRWKRRRKRLSERVQAVGGKLVVAPSPA